MIPTRLDGLLRDFVFVGFYRDRTRIYAGYASKEITTIPMDELHIDPLELDKLEKLANSSEVILFERNCLSVKQGSLLTGVPLSGQQAVVYHYHLPSFDRAIAYLTCDHSTPATNKTVSFVHYSSRVLRWEIMHLKSIAVRKGFSTLVQEIKHED